MQGVKNECPYCGAEMSELDHFCTKCGLGTQAFDVADKRDSGKKKKGLRWWVVLLAAVLVCAVLVIALWSRLSLYLSPELGLVEALDNTSRDISARVEESPASALLMASQWEEGSRTTVSFDLAVIGFDAFGAEVASASNPGNGSFMISTTQKLFGQNSSAYVYVTEDAVVFTEDASADSQAYRVDFDTLSAVLGSEQFSGVDNQLLDSFAASVNALRMPSGGFDREKLNKRYIKALMDILKDSERTVSYEDHMLEGRQRNCGVITYSLNNFVLAQGFDALADIAQEDGMLTGSYRSQQAMNSTGLTKQEKEDADIPAVLRRSAEELRQDRSGGVTVTFHLFEKKVVRFCLTRQSQGATVLSVDVELGLDPSRGDIMVVCVKEGEQKNYLLRSDFGDVHTDTLTISTQGRTDMISWSWDRQSGALPISLTLEGEEMRISGQLVADENGFLLELPDVLGLIGTEGIADMGIVQSLAKLDISISVAKGGDFRIPQGKPLEEWSEAELKYIIKNFLS